MCCLWNVGCSIVLGKEGRPASRRVCMRVLLSSWHLSHPCLFGGHKGHSRACMSHAGLVLPCIPPCPSSSSHPTHTISITYVIRLDVQGEVARALGVGELGQVCPRSLIAERHLPRDDLGRGRPEGLEEEEERAGRGHQRQAAAAGARRGCHGSLWGMVLAFMCVRRCRGRGRGVRVVPTLHVRIDGGLCVCREAGISKVNEWVACRGGAAYVWLERRLARSKSFPHSSQQLARAIHEKR